MLRLILSAVVIYLASVEVAKAYSGLDLLRGCTDMLRIAAGQNFQLENTVQAGMCAGYISGIMDANQVVIAVRGRPMALFCTPERGLENEQIIRIVVKHLTENPADLHQPARLSVVIALRQAFPCTAR